MALTKTQADHIMTLFVNSFVTAGEDERRRLFLDFGDNLGRSITGWQAICSEKLNHATGDEKIIEEYEQLVHRNDTGRMIDGVEVRLMEPKDWAAVRELINRAFHKGLAPYDDDILNNYFSDGYSFVAVLGEEILGALLAFRIPDMNVEALYIDTVVVGEMVRNRGIGKKLLESAAKKAEDNDVYSMRLMTSPDIEAYHIYKHLGFEEVNMVQMLKYII